MKALQKLVSFIPDSSDYPWSNEEELSKKSTEGVLGIDSLIKTRSLLSSIYLQSCLYYNLLFDIAYVFTWIPIFRWKFDSSPTIFVYIDLIVYIIWIICESGRIFLGYYGNLMERVPHMASFIFVSLFPQIPLLIYLTILGAPITPFEQIGGIFLILFLAFELYFSWYALQAIIREQTARFLLDGLDRLDDYHKTADEREEEKALLNRKSTFMNSKKGSVTIDSVGMMKGEQNALFQRTASSIELGVRPSNRN